MLTKEQLKKIEEIIRKRFLAFTYEAIGERALTSDEINMLKRAGLLRESVRNFVGDAYVLGKIAGMVKDRTDVEELTYEQILKLAKGMSPLTSIERKAIEWAQTHAGENIKGLGGLAVKESASAAARISANALRAVQDEIVSAITDRKSVSQLKTALFAAIDDRYRDWQRVASTELTDAIQKGIYAEIRESSEHGSDQLVYKKPNADACDHCRRLYLKADGTPKIFKLSELHDSNVGLKASEWKATIGPVHPWCQCQLLSIPDGFGFVRRRVVVEEFEKAGHTYRKGTIINDADYARLSESQKQKIGFDSILEFTGTEKSFAQGGLNA